MLQLPVLLLSSITLLPDVLGLGNCKCIVLYVLALFSFGRRPLDMKLENRSREEDDSWLWATNSSGKWNGMV